MAKANNFQQEVGRFLTDRFDLSYRLDDSAFNRYGGRIVSKKPFDFFGSTSEGIFWGAESKRIKSIRFPTSSIQLHQRESLISLLNSNAYSWLFINWRITRAGIAIWIPFEEYCDIEYIKISDGKKSLKPSDFDEKWFLKRITGGWVIEEKHPLYKVR